MVQGLFTVDEVCTMIESGSNLLLAGDAKLLSRLPAGNWIGGSTPFFIVHPENRTTCFDKIFVNMLPNFVTKVEIKEYDETNIKNIFNDGPKNGFTVLILPWTSPVQVEYSMHATHYENFAAHPVCGWITGLPLDIILTEKSHTASGLTPCISHEKAYAMHVSLPDSKFAEIHIFNPYKEGKADCIQFENDGVMITDALINGKKQNFAKYLRDINYNLLMPLAANYSGAVVNNVVCAIDGDVVPMSAPVFKNVEYRIAEIDDNISEISLLGEKIVFSITCIGNFIQPDICSQYLKKMNGPVVFGEIAYQHLCQTTVYVTIDDVTLNTELK